MAIIKAVLKTLIFCLMGFVFFGWLFLACVEIGISPMFSVGFVASMVVVFFTFKKRLLQW